MKVLYNKKFLKDLSKIPSKERKKIEHLVFKELPLKKAVSHIKAKQLKGHPGYYQMRFGDYRVGFSFQKNVLTLERVLHRKNIYRLFP